MKHLLLLSMFVVFTCSSDSAQQGIDSHRQHRAAKQLMAFYIVMHHSADPNQLWANDWEAQTLLRTLTTPKDIAVKLADAKVNNERIFIYRCA